MQRGHTVPHNAALQPAGGSAARPCTSTVQRHEPGTPLPSVMRQPRHSPAYTPRVQHILERLQQTCAVVCQPLRQASAAGVRTHIMGSPAAPTLAAYHSRALAMALLSVRPPQN
eukprot:GHRQ01039864.1.p3 GENE.GHRQ01039864.1~~GHRQ01039864.1.p3  ORF type:complete len:114 (+),score=19.43 GHRQ01039864.1:116-457(+)